MNVGTPARLAPEHAALIKRSLENVAERGDPVAVVYARVFAAYPEMEKLFVRDTNGLVRGNMLAETVNAILDFIDRDTYGGNLMRIEIVNHENFGRAARGVSKLLHRHARRVRRLPRRRLDG